MAFPLVDAAGSEKDETAQLCSICDADNVCVEPRERFMAAVTTAEALAICALDEDNCSLVQAPARVRRPTWFWRLPWGRG